MFPVAPLNTDVKSIVVGLALRAKTRGRRRERIRDSMNTGPNRWWGNVVGFVVSVALVGSVLTVAPIAGWNRDRAMWVGFGGFLALMTLLRPSWFWENYRARWLRNVIGDGGTTVVYLAFAAIMVWIGLNTDWGFGRR
jgi:hypothetical protein